MHGLMPPHPGPVVAIQALHANPGMVAIWALILGLPTAAIAGPLFAKWASRHVDVPPPVIALQPLEPGRRWPDFGLTLFSMLLPVLLILMGTIAGLLLQPGTMGRDIAAFIGSPAIALLISVLFALWSLGTKCGFTRAATVEIRRGIRRLDRHGGIDRGRRRRVCARLASQRVGGGDGFTGPERCICRPWYMPGWYRPSFGLPPVRRQSPSPPRRD